MLRVVEHARVEAVRVEEMGRKVAVVAAEIRNHVEQARVEACDICDRGLLAAGRPVIGVHGEGSVEGGRAHEKEVSRAGVVNLSSNYKHEESMLICPPQCRRTLFIDVL